ncbi:hypothetical protein V1525DRAFT_407240 [Lipomyces kononenkoae]|uniref:Uncharacterized protein n=1 Tax=Lipomyces kononenkoae TaxID=34357 RepID=A0ACC3SXD1_LIPKO
MYSPTVHPTGPQIHAFASDSILVIPINIVSALALMAARIPLSCLADDTDSDSKRRSYPDATTQHPRQNDRKSFSLPPMHTFPQRPSGGDRRTSVSSPRPALSTSLTPAVTSSSRSSSAPSLSLSLSRSPGSRSTTSTSQIPGLSRPVTESYILATPPPRPGYSQNHLIFQIQRLTSRHVLPVFNVKRPVASPVPVAALQKKVKVPKKLSPAQFVVYSCDDIEHDTRTAVLHATGHELKFGHFSGLTWRLRTDGPSLSVLVIAVSENDGQKTFGRWTPSKVGGSGTPPSAGSYPLGEGSWQFVVKGEVLATLQGHRVDIAPAAADISRKGYLGRLRFEEAIVMSSVFIENMSIFGRPPQVDSERTSVSEERISSSCSIIPSPASVSPVAVSKKLEHHASMPSTMSRSSAELDRLSRLGGSILRRGRTLLWRKSPSMASQKTIIA